MRPILGTPALSHMFDKPSPATASAGGVPSIGREGHRARAWRPHANSAHNTCRHQHQGPWCGPLRSYGVCVRACVCMYALQGPPTVRRTSILRACWPSGAVAGGGCGRSCLTSGAAAGGRHNGEGFAAMCAVNCNTHMPMHSVRRYKYMLMYSKPSPLSHVKRLLLEGVGRPT